MLLTSLQGGRQQRTMPTTVTGFICRPPVSRQTRMVHTSPAAERRTHKELCPHFIADVVWHCDLHADSCEGHAGYMAEFCPAACQSADQALLLDGHILLPGAPALELRPLHGHHALPFGKLAAASAVLVHPADACDQEASAGAAVTRT